MILQNPTDRIAIDRLTYLASLVSDPAAVDEKLDTLRLVTANVNEAQGLNDQDKQSLAQLETELKEYLVTSDPVRKFTYEGLQQKIDRKFHSGDPNARTPLSTFRQLMIIFLLAFAAYGVGLLFAPGELATRFQLASPLFLVQLHAGLAWLFWSGRKELVAALRVAYQYISWGLILSAVGAVQFPILFAYPSLTENPFFRYAGFMPPFPVMCVLFYFGLYIYARQLPNMKLRFLTPTWVLSAVLVLSIIVVLAPHSAHVPEELFFDTSLLATMLSVVFSVPAALLGFAITRNLTARYSKAMRLFAGAQIAVAVACAIFFSVLFVSGPMSGTKVAVAAMPFGVSEVLMLVSAYLFKRSVSE